MFQLHDETVLYEGTKYIKLNINIITVTVWFKDLDQKMAETKGGA